MNIRELITKIGFDFDEAKLKVIDKAITGVKHSLEAIAGGAVAAAFSLYEMSSSAAETGEELELTSNRVGLTVKELQEYQGAAKLAGLDTETFNSGMQRFNRLVGEAAENSGEAQKKFAKYGISIRDGSGHLKSNSELISEVSDKMQGLTSAAERGALAFDFFFIGGVNMVNMLKGGSAELDRQRALVQKVSYLYSEDAVEASRKFEVNLKIAQMAVTGLKNEIGVSLIPVITEVTSKFIDWFQANRAVLAQRLEAFFKGLATFVHTVWIGLSALVDGFSAFVKVIGGAQKAAFYFAAALYLIIATRVVSGFAALYREGLKLIAMFSTLGIRATLANIAIAALPLIIAFIGTAIALFVNDLYNFEKGNKSVLGLIIKEWDAWLNKIKEAHPVLAGVLKIVNALGQSLQNTGEFIGTTAAKVNLLAHGQKLPGDPLSFGSVAHSLGYGVPLHVPRFGSGSRGATVNSNVNVTVNAPPGTTEQHQKFLKDSAKVAFEDETQKHLRQIMVAVPRIN